MKREFAALVVGVGIFEGRRRVGVGDEYVLIRSVSGALPDELEAQPLLVVSVAIRRLRRTYERESAGVPQRGGQITRVRDSGHC